MLRLCVLMFVGFCCCMLIAEGETEESCGATGPPQSLQYKGRFFQDTKINSTDFISNATISSVYGCRQMCATRERDCLAISYNTSKEATVNCWLYNLTRIKSYMIAAAESFVILLLPIECGNESAVDGGWSSWQQATGCSSSCGTGWQRFTRSCSQPARICNGHRCPGSDKKTELCQIQECVLTSCIEALAQSGRSDGIFQIRPINENPEGAVITLPCTRASGNFTAILPLTSDGMFEWDSSNGGEFSVGYNNTDDEMRIIIANSVACRQHIAIECYRAGVSLWRSFNLIGPTIRYYPTTTNPEDECACSGVEACCCDDDKPDVQLPDCDYHSSCDVRSLNDYGYLAKTADLPVKMFQTYSSTTEENSSLILGPLECQC